MTASSVRRPERARPSRGRRASRIAVRIAILVAAVLIYAFVLSRGAVL